jgi:hypothetical protein
MRHKSLAALLAAVVASTVAVATPATAAVFDVYYRCGDNLCRIASNGAGATQLTSDGTAAEPYRGPTLNADGTRLAFRKGNRVFVGDPSTGGRIEISAGNVNRGIWLSRDGATAAVALERTLFYPPFSENWLKLYRADGTGAPWGDNEDGVTATWLGDRLVTDQLKDGHLGLCIWKTGAELGCERWVAFDPQFEMWSPDGSPDGRYVVSDATAPDGTSKISLFDAATSARVRDLTAGPADSEPAFSPDGAEVAFQRGMQIFVLPMAGGSERLLVDGQAPAWGARHPDPVVTPPGPPQQPPTSPPSTAPTKVLTSVRLASTRVRSRNGLSITVRLATASRITVEVRRKAGRTWRRVGRVARSLTAGTSTIRVRKLAGKRLRRGSYRAVIKVTAGGRTESRTLTFKVVS